MARGPKLIAVLATVAAFSGCGDSSDPDREKPVDALWNTSYVSTHVTEAGEPRPLAKGTRIGLDFGAPRSHSIGWSAGCNSFGGTAQVSTETIRLTEIGGTLIGCMPKLQAQDEWLSDFFASSPTWDLNGGLLTLTSGETAIELRAG